MDSRAGLRQALGLGLGAIARTARPAHCVRFRRRARIQVCVTPRPAWNDAMQYWLLKTEPDAFSWDRLVAAGPTGEDWDGVRNHQAAGYLRQMRTGDHAFVYHTGKERRIVGLAEVIREFFPDLSDPDGRFVAVTVRAVRPLAAPVTLAAIKADPALTDFLLVRHSRLSVIPVSAAHWRHILKLARA